MTRRLKGLFSLSDSSGPIIQNPYRKTPLGWVREARPLIFTAAAPVDPHGQLTAARVPVCLQLVRPQPKGPRLRTNLLFMTCVPACS